MLAAIVRASLGNPRIVTALACLIAALGVAALVAARFDVFPDFAPPHVLVQTEAPGLDATQVEALVTRPLEGLLAGTDSVGTGALFRLIHIGDTLVPINPDELPSRLVAAGFEQPAVDRVERSFRFRARTPA